MRSGHIRCTMACVAVTGALLAGCGRGSSQPTVVPQPGPESTATSSTAATPTATPSSVRLSLEKVAAGLDAPLYLTNASDGSGRLFVVEQGGRIRVIRDGRLLPAPYLDISSQISSGGERGLLGLAFAWDYERSGRFYVDYTDPAGNTVIARCVADSPNSDAPKISGPTPILRIAQPYANHNGGCLQMDPNHPDREVLYIGMGDGGSAGDPQNRAQNPRVLLGKLLRIDVGSVAKYPSKKAPAYSIPADNPSQAPGNAGTVSPEVWAIGVRNPWRFSFDRATGDLWIGDVGQNAWEEVDFVDAIDVKSPGPRIRNFGWRLYEGTHPYDPKHPPAPTAGLTFPVIEYSHSAGESVTGGYVYRGVASPALRGIYVYGDFVSGRIWGARRSSGGAIDNAELLHSDKAISSFGEGEDGEVYLTDLNAGDVYRLVGK